MEQTQGYKFINQLYVQNFFFFLNDDKIFT